MSDLRKYIQAQKFKLAGGGISSAATSMTLQSFALPDGTPITTAMIGSLITGTIEPNTSKEEIISFTTVTQNMDGTATLSGLTRGLKFVAPYDSDGALAQSHGGGTTFILTNNPQMYDGFINKNNDETIAGIFTFATGATPIITDQPTTDTQAANKKYVDDISIASAPNASTTTKGIVKMSTAPASATEPIAVGDNDTRVPTQGENDALAGTSGTPSSTNKYVTNDDTSATSSASKVVRANESGKIDSSFLSSSTVYNTGVTTRAFNTASGSQTIAHGLGVVPKRVAINVGMVELSSSGNHSGFSMSSGVYANSNTSCVYNYGGSLISSNIVSSGSGNSSTYIIYITNVYNSGGDQFQTQLATITTDSTNITLTWTLSDPYNLGISKTMNIMWEAIG